MEPHVDYPELSPTKVTQSSKGGRLRVRETGNGRVSMLTPNEEALRCKDLGLQ